MKPFIIAEIGINHNGNLELAKKMIASAKKCGADAVKFQKREIELVYTKKFLSEYRESQWGTTQYDQKKGLEFGESDYDEIDRYCKEQNIKWFASAWDEVSLDFLDKYNLEYNKIPSAMIIDKKFIKRVAKKNKYTFISTGMCNFDDIKNCVKIFKENQCKFELMHCISVYPFPSEYANLPMIKYLKAKFECNVGYSGHEKSGLAISYAAVALGATSIERHFTTDRTLPGSDQAASMSPSGFAELCGGINEISMGMKFNEKKEILDIEKPVADKLRMHIQN